MTASCVRPCLAICSMLALTVRRDPSHVAEIEGQAAEVTKTIIDMQSEARRLSEQQTALRRQADQLAAAVAPQRELVSA